MKKIIKNPIFTFILGAIIFGGIVGVSAYTILANDIGYTPSDSTWKKTNGEDITNVKDAIDELYTKSTAYKKLDTTTTASASDMLSGKTAYDNNGNLITGTLSTTEYSTYLVVHGQNGTMGELNLMNNAFTKFKYSNLVCSSGNSATVYSYDSTFNNRSNINSDTEYPVNNTYYRIYIQKTSGNDWCQIQLTFYN